MERRLIVSGGGAVRAYSLPEMACTAEALLPRCGMLCAGGGHVYCACDGENVIWRLDAQTLMPSALFAGGPGMCDLLLSPGGERLYALCGEADSVLAVDARTGAAQLLCRAGANPRRMTLDETGKILAVAGGESGSVLLLCAHTLETLAVLPMPGPVYDAAFYAGSVCALCLSETLDSLLVLTQHSGAAQTLHLAGMPGALLSCNGVLYAAAQERLYCVSTAGTACTRAPGRAGRLLRTAQGMLLCDMYMESVFAAEDDGVRRLCSQARDIALI